jgi:uncharacterized protein YkwD
MRLMRIWFGAVVIFSGCAAATNTPLDLSTDGPATLVSAAVVQHNLDALNLYRTQAGVPSLVLDQKMSSFATDGSLALASGGATHGHITQAAQDGSLAKAGFCNGWGENQAPNWVGPDQNADIDAILQAEMAEGPGGGHHDNIVNPMWTRVGIGLIVEGGLYMTNDFSPPCP